MYLRKNRGIILLVAFVLVLMIITGTFVFTVRPRASLLAKEGEGFITLEHSGGEPLAWKDLRISVTEGKDSSPSFVDSTESNSPLEPIPKDDNFTPGESVVVRRNTSEDSSSLEEEKWYHVIVKHGPTNTLIMDMNVQVRRKYR